MSTFCSPAGCGGSSSRAHHTHGQWLCAVDVDEHECRSQPASLAGTAACLRLNCGNGPAMATRGYAQWHWCIKVGVQQPWRVWLHEAVT